jgi:hypothetical protein
MAAHGRVLASRWWCVTKAGDRIIRWSTALAVLGVAAITAVVPYEHASVRVAETRRVRLTGRLIPLTVDGLTYASSMVMSDSARRGVRAGGLTRAAAMPTLTWPGVAPSTRVAVGRSTVAVAHAIS